MESNGRIITIDQISAMCRRGFGTGFRIQSLEELPGGTFNTTFLVTSQGQNKIILRVAPPQREDTYWEESQLMRREHVMQPFFAPVASLMPKTLLADFTHQLIDRDYMIQSFIEGERWDKIMDELTDTENNILWTQFGGLVRTIHDVRGERFGLPLPGHLFPTWSQAVIDRLERTLQAATDSQLEIPYLKSILETVREHPQQLDEIQTPRLLHGDLWSFNILVARGAGDLVIVGLLDADRSWWGDPFADWTMFILAHAEAEDGHSHFWGAYGQTEETQGSRYRKIVYDAMHAATAFLWAVRNQDKETVERATGTLGEVAEVLSELL